MAGNINQTYIIDSSYLLAYLFPDEENSQVQLFFNKYKEQNIQLIASPMLPFEVINGFQAGILTKRLNYKVALQLCKKFLELPIQLRDVNFLKVFKLSASHKMSFYDASYLYLAQSQNLPLLTLDKHLIPFSQH